MIGKFRILPRQNRVAVVRLLRRGVPLPLALAHVALLRGICEATPEQRAALKMAMEKGTT